MMRGVREEDRSMPRAREVTPNTFASNHASPSRGRHLFTMCLTPPACDGPCCRISIQISSSPSIDLCFEHGLY